MDESFASRLQMAFNTRDIDTLRSLLAEDAIWGEDPADDESFCHDRDAIIRHLKQLLADGVRATITETTTGRGGVAAVVEVGWPDQADAPSDRPLLVFQAYLVVDGRVSEIHGHDDWQSAVSAISD